MGQRMQRNKESHQMFSLLRCILRVLCVKYNLPIAQPYSYGIWRLVRTYSFFEHAFHCIGTVEFYKT